MYSAFALIDIMKESDHTISTVGVGAVMSALLIFISGKQGYRYIENTGIMNHQHSDAMESRCTI